MKQLPRYFFIIFLFVVGWAAGTSAPASAEENGKVRLVVQPWRYALVNGDVDKFRSIRWMKDGASWGGTSLSFDEKVGKGTISFEGSTSPQDNDHDAAFVYRKGDKGYLKTEYKAFRKYYDKNGGVYNRFTTFKAPELNNRDLTMDMGNFKLEGGLGALTDPDLAIAYERLTKKGRKSMLAWGSVKEGTASKKIAPTFEELDQTSDVITLKGKKEVAGVLVKAEQEARFDRTNSYMEQKLLSTSGTASDTLIRGQIETPQVDMLSSGLWGEKWMLNDKTFVGMGYHYSHATADDNRTLTEMTSNYALNNYSSAKQSTDSPATIKESVHALTGNMHTSLTDNLSFISKFKIEQTAKDGTSAYLPDASPTYPNGIPEKFDYSSIEQKVKRYGENVSLRYTGIAHTALYAELEMEQTRNWMQKILKTLPGSAAANTPFYEENLNDSTKTSWTMGGRVIPSKYFNITAQGRQRYQTNDYDNVNFSGSPVTVLDGMKIDSNEAETKATWKPWHWLQNSVRYQYRSSKYFPRAENFIQAKNLMLENIYTYDITLQPMDPLLLMLSYSADQLSVKTIGGSYSNDVPGSNSWVNSWLFSTSYTPKENLTLTNTVTYSFADNLGDDSEDLVTRLPYEAAFDQLGVTTGLQWSPKKGVTVSPSYEYASYVGNPAVDVSNYTAHIFQVNVGLEW